MTPALAQALQAAPFWRIGLLWRDIEDRFGLDGQAWLGRHDRMYLLARLLGRPDALHPWVYVRCREVEAKPDGCLDLWAREHYKSTVITFAGIVQEIVRDPEITVAIFSHTKPIARKFFQQIKQEFEGNEVLKSVYEDVLWADPRKDSPRWSDEKGIVVKRQGNPKEATLEAHGLVDGQPTGAHFKLRVYDDVVTLESVTTPEQVNKTTQAWALSDNLGAVTRTADGREVMRAWHIGTRYSYRDTYQHILDKRALRPRIYAATDDGTLAGRPVFLGRDVWAHKLKTQTEAVLACQQLQNPASGSQAMFRKEHLRFAEVRPRTLNVYIMCDPASSRKVGSDRTAVMVVGVDAGGNKWLLDGALHRMNLHERWQTIRSLRRKWMRKPGVQGVWVGYERYGMRSDIEHFEGEMERDGDRFTIAELAWPTDGTKAKLDRIQRLYPDFAQSRIFLPRTVPAQPGKAAALTKDQRRVSEMGEPDRIFAPIRRRNEAGEAYSLVAELLNEYLVYPFAPHDDGLDCLSRIYDMDARPPETVADGSTEPEVFSDGI